MKYVTTYIFIISIIFFGVFNSERISALEFESNFLFSHKNIEKNTYISQIQDDNANFNVFTLINRLEAVKSELESKNEMLIQTESKLETKQKKLVELNNKIQKKKGEQEVLDEAIQKRKRELYPFAKPTDGDVKVTSEFGMRIHPISGERKGHSGVDLAKPGKVEIKAARDGVVSKSYSSKGYGEVIFIKHNIDGQVWETVYAHMRTGTRQFKEGEEVKEGDVLGLMGSTGNSTGQHLHFEVHKGEWQKFQPNAVDPFLFTLFNFV